MKHIVSHLLLSAGLMLPMLPSAYADISHAPPPAALQHCAKPVFYAKTANHKKEVEICIVSPSVSYSFGKTGDTHKEMSITIPSDHASYAYQSNQAISLQEFTVRNGDTRYLISAGTNGEGKPFASIDVYKGAPDSGKRLAEIELDPHTVVNNISHALSEEGIAESDSL
ncbi:hypothetical protein [Rouxiella badensis]|uniref:hypothetical protein n=1 Tax=Rouxiella badensis TaxID=1646377 RepID=UPI0022AB05D9|nr:hypothetical protein [Rouxiella badensis]WAT07366.1 hypothetical protein O1V65_13780 [Rouxiella badensis]